MSSSKRKRFESPAAALKALQVSTEIEADSGDDKELDAAQDFRVLIEWGRCEENFYYKGKMRKHFPTTMMNELDLLDLIPRHIRELLKDYIKESDETKKTSLGFSLERKIIEENSKQKLKCFVGFRIIEEIESLKVNEKVNMDLIWKKLKTVDEIKLLLAPHNEDAKYIVWNLIQSEADEDPIPIIGLQHLDKKRLLGARRLILLDKIESEYIVMIDYVNNCVYSMVYPDSNVRVSWILKLIKDNIVGKPGMH